MTQFREARLKYQQGSPIDRRIEDLVDFFGVDKAAVLQMAIKFFSDQVFPEKARAGTMLRGEKAGAEQLANHGWEATSSALTERENPDGNSEQTQS